MPSLLCAAGRRTARVLGREPRGRHDHDGDADRGSARGPVAAAEKESAGAVVAGVHRA